VHLIGGGILLVDPCQPDAISSSDLKKWASSNNYPIDQVPIEVDDTMTLTLTSDFNTYIFPQELALTGDWESDLLAGQGLIQTSLIPAASTSVRERAPAAALGIAQQCGGSDAFSGICSNPLIGWVSRELIKHGGKALLAETDELISAESYILANCKDLETAR